MLAPAAGIFTLNLLSLRPPAKGGYWEVALRARFAPGHADLEVGMAAWKGCATSCA